jgi:putative inorganic carbon (HCO3(-)) transporter
MTALTLRVRQYRPRSPVVLGVGVAILAIALVTGYGVVLLALAIGIPVVCAVALRPQRGVILLTAVLPFDGIIKQFGPGFMDPWKQAAILGLLLLTFVCPEDARGAKGRKLPSWVWAVAGLLVMGFLSALTVDRQTALVGLRIGYFSILLAYAIWRCPFTRRDRDHLVTAFLTVAIITSLVGLWQQVVGESYLHGLGYEYGDTIRFTSGFTMRSFSTFNLPFAFGFYLMLAILILLPMSLADPHRLRSKVFFVASPVIVLALLYSFVRGAFLGLAAGLLYLAFHRYKYLVYGIPLVLVLALFIPSGAAITNAVFSSSSLQERTLSWGDRLDLFAENPFGTGIGTTGAAAEKAAKLNFQNPDLTYVPDNTFLKEMFELGILGLWFLVLLGVAMFVSVRRTERRSTGEDRDFLSGVAAQLLAIAMASLVATYLELVPMDQLFWVMIAVAATMEPQTPKEPAVYRPGVRERIRLRAGTR